MKKILKAFILYTKSRMAHKYVDFQFHTLIMIRCLGNVFFTL